MAKTYKNEALRLAKTIAKDENISFREALLKIKEV